jgi:hypothetical protein
VNCGIGVREFEAGKELWYSYWLWTHWPMFFGLAGALSGWVVVWDDEEDERIEKEGWVSLPQGERHCNLNR